MMWGRVGASCDDYRKGAFPIQKKAPRRECPLLGAFAFALDAPYRLSLPQISYMHDETTEYQYDALGGQ